MPTTTMLLLSSLAVLSQLLSALALIVHALMGLAVGRVADVPRARTSELHRLHRLHRVQAGMPQLPRPLAA